MLLYLLLLSSILTSIQAANIDIQWAIQTYDDTTAQVGDTITFTWSSGHNVYIQPSGTCQADGAIPVGETSPAIYTFTANDVGQDLFFVCGVEGHCAAGQTITVSVTAATAATTEVSTNVPTDNGTGTSGSDIPTDTTTGTPTAAPMEAEGNNGGSSSIPSIGPSTMGGGSATQAPTSASGGTTITMTASTIMMLLFVLTVSTVALARTA